MTAREPEDILGISAASTDEEIRAAYLAQVKRHPPEREPERFEEIRDAYAALRDTRGRLRRALFGRGPLTPLDSLIDGNPGERRYAGPELWLRVLKSTPPRQEKA